MQVEASDESSAEEHEKAHIPRDRPLGVIHSGNRYAYGYGPDFYGIWDAAASGPPSETFPASDEGRMAGWKRYVELEPDAAGVVTTTESPDVVWRRETEQARRRRRRNSLITTAAIVVVIVGGIIALAVFKGGAGTKATTELSAEAKAKKAHLDVLGATSVSEDLTQTEFSSTSIESLFGGGTKGVWKGTTTELTINMHTPTVGTVSTTQIGTTRFLSVTITKADGTAVTYLSNHGECKITLANVLDAGFSGSFDCTSIPATVGTDTVDAKGTFGASK